MTREMIAPVEHGIEIQSDSGLSDTSAKTHHSNVRTTKDTCENKKTGDDEQLEFLVRTMGLLSIGIGNVRRNKWLGCVGLLFWISNIVVHFSLDFYEAKFVFHVSWASSVALFFVVLVVCSICSIKYSIPWFIRGLRKLARDGKKYLKTLRRLCRYFKVTRALILPLSVGTAMGQFGCYAYDDALDLNFSDGLSSNGSAPSDAVPRSVMVFVNVIRATSLVHIFYGFWFFLLVHMGMIYMIKSSMEEYIECMAKALRQTPVSITFSEAVNSFAARSRFVNRGSISTTGVFTILLVVSSTSFVLNAYNYLFLKKYAIYIWFALAPLIWAVTPLIGAAWVTRHYQRYKLVVVNAWVDVPDDEELDDDDDVTESGRRFSSTSTRLRCCQSNTSSVKSSFMAGSAKNNHLTVNGATCGITQSPGLRFKPGLLNGAWNKKRNNSEDTRSFEIKRSRSLNDLTLSDCISFVSSASLRSSNTLQVNSSLLPNGINKICASQDIKTSHSARPDVKHLKHSYNNVGYIENEDGETRKPINNRTFQEPRIEITDLDAEPGKAHPSPCADPELSKRSKTSQLFSGIAKTYSRWRARVKARRKFNFEKYITYLDITLPTVGFSIGGVVITWDAVSGFCFLLFTLVGIFAQEAFFGG